MRNRTQLAADKQFLQAIVDNNNHIPDDIDYFLFLKALLQNFASTDPQLRDNLTYSVLAHAIIDQDSQRSEEHTSELQSPDHLVCRLLLEKKKNTSHQRGTVKIMLKSLRLKLVDCYRLS